MKISKLLFAGALMSSMLFTSCENGFKAYANENTSREGVPDENHNHVRNDAVAPEDRASGSDCNPTNKLYDGITSPEEKVAGKPDKCCEKGECKEEGGKKEGEEKEEHKEAESK